MSLNISFFEFNNETCNNVEFKSIYYSNYSYFIVFTVVV